MTRDGYELLQRIEALMQAEGARLQASIHAIVRHAQENILSQLDDTIASTNAKVEALAAEVTKANAKTDAALAALAASVASGSPVTQAQIDAINAIGAAADTATGALQAEESKVDAATGESADTGSGDSSAT